MFDTVLPFYLIDGRREDHLNNVKAAKLCSIVTCIIMRACNEQCIHSVN